MQQIIDTLMASARATASLTGRSDLRSVLDVLAEGSAAAHAGLGVTVEVEPGALVGVDPALLERLASPVVENAGRFARTAVQLHGRRWAAGSRCSS